MRKAACLFLIAFLVSSSALLTPAQKRGVKALTAPVLAESTRFAGVRAYTDGFMVWLSWQMESEVGNIGFNVYRGGKRGTELLNPAKMVSGAAMRSRQGVERSQPRSTT